jgi:ankyrin repeat protein
MLTVAIHENWGKKVEYLLDHGANVEGSEFHDQRTPLMIAAECETNEYILALLLDRNANINAQDFHGKTALIHATEVGRSKTVQYLLTRRADRTIVDHKGFDALHYARLRKSSIFVELLG